MERRNPRSVALHIRNRMTGYLFQEDVQTRVKKRCEKAECIHLFLDYDGTLIEFTDDPKEGYPNQRLLDILKNLVDTPGIQVAIISGRKLSQLIKLLDLDGLTYGGVHGLKIKYPGGKEFCWNYLDQLKPTLGKIKKELSQAFEGIGDVFLEDKEVALGLHYRKYKDDPQDLIDKFYQVVRKRLDGLEILHGDKILEVRPEGWHKGKAVELIGKEFSKENSDQPITLPIYIGDDRTDEDAFRYLRSGITICVLNNQKRNTRAQYYCQNPREVQRFLNQLLYWKR